MSGVAVLTLVHTAISLAPTQTEPPFGITHASRRTRTATPSPRPAV